VREGDGPACERICQQATWFTRRVPEFISMARCLVAQARRLHAGALQQPVAEDDVEQFGGDIVDLLVAVDDDIPAIDGEDPASWPVGTSPVLLEALSLLREWSRAADGWLRKLDEFQGPPFLAWGLDLLRMPPEVWLPLEEAAGLLERAWEAGRRAADGISVPAGDFRGLRATGRPGRPPKYDREVLAYALRLRQGEPGLTAKELMRRCRQHSPTGRIPRGLKAFREWLRRGA
jgi:hypothetical protein